MGSLRSPSVILVVALMLAAWAPPARPALAQTPALSGATGASMESYRFTNPGAVNAEHVTLLTAPLAASIQLGATSLEFSSAIARGALTRADGTTSSISGPTDARLALQVPLLGESAAVTAFAVLPTGSTHAGPRQVEIAGIVAADLLPFSISHWGSGGGAGLAASLRRPLGAAAVEMGASYMISRPYDAAESRGLVEYRVGDQLGVQFGVEGPLARSGVVSLQLGFQRQNADELGGDNLFRSGNRFQAIGSYAFVFGGGTSGVVYAAGQRRENGTALLEVTRDSPEQDLALAGAGLRLPVRGSTVFLPGVDARAFRSADGIGQGYLGGASAALELNLGSLRLEPRIRGQAGRVLVRGGRSSGVIGLNLGLTISARRPP